jgi:hypothetical protein
MTVMLERWNDDKMDALDAKVDRIDRRMEKGFEHVDEEFKEVRGELKGMHRLMVQAVVAISGSMVLGSGALAAAIIAKL